MSLIRDQRGTTSSQQVALTVVVGAVVISSLSGLGTSLGDVTTGTVESEPTALSNDAYGGEPTPTFDEGTYAMQPLGSNASELSTVGSSQHAGTVEATALREPSRGSRSVDDAEAVALVYGASVDAGSGGGLFGGFRLFGGGVPWGNILKGAAIVGAAVAVTVALVVAAPVGLAVAAVAGVAAAIVTATLIETGEATVHGFRTGEWDYSEALDPGEALGSFVVESARGLATVANPRNWDDIYDSVRECPSCMFQQMADNFKTCFAAGDSAACVQGVTEAATWVGAGQVVTAPARSALVATRPGALVASQAAATRAALAATRPATFVSSNIAAARAAVLGMRLPLSPQGSLDMPPLSADEASRLLDEINALDARTLSAEETSQLLDEIYSSQTDDVLHANATPAVSVIGVDELAPQLDALQASAPPGVRRKPMPDGSSPLRAPNADLGEVYPTIAMDPRHASESSYVTYFETPEDRSIYAMEVRDGSLHDGFFPISETPNPEGYIYVMDGRGGFFVSSDAEVGAFHHSSFLAGDPVAAAGHIWEVDGTVYINNNSGHYQPPPGMTENAKAQLIEMGVDPDSIVVLDKDALPPGIEKPVDTRSAADVLRDMGW